MNSSIATTARTLAAGDPFRALNRVALRDDAAALALRNITMTQLGDLARARLLLRHAARTFGAREAVARARCIVAKTEVALASRDLGRPTRTLRTACATPEAHSDHVNAAHARYLGVRRLLLIGRLDDTEAALATLTPTPLPPALQTAHALVVAGIAVRRLQADAARAVLSDTERAARQADIPTLTAGAERTVLALNAPTTHLISRGEECVLHPDDVETLFASDVLVVDVYRLAIRQISTIVPLTTRPALFTLARALAEAQPEDEARDALTARTFRTRHPGESHRVRLRAGIGRLCTTLGALGMIKATQHGFALQPHAAQTVVVLAQPVAKQYAAVLACLADGESWSSSALALALGTSRRTVQRVLDALATAGKTQSFGHGHTRRQVTPPLPGFVATLLLPAPLPSNQDEDCVTESSEPHMKRSTAEVVREYGPFPGAENVGGVTYDDRHAWFTTGGQLKKLDPDSGETRCSIGIPAHAGTAFDRRHLFRIAKDRVQKIDPQTGTVLVTTPAPGVSGDSGLVWAEGALWVGHYRERKIRQIDPDTSKALHTIESNRFVTGIMWVDGGL